MNSISQRIYSLISAWSSFASHDNPLVLSHTIWPSGPLCKS